MPYIPGQGGDEHLEHKVDPGPGIPDPVPVAVPIGNDELEVDDPAVDNPAVDDPEADDPAVDDPEVDDPAVDDPVDIPHPQVVVSWYMIVDNELVSVPIPISYCMGCHHDRATQIRALFDKIVILMGQMVTYRDNPLVFELRAAIQRISYAHMEWIMDMADAGVPSPDNFLFGVKLPGDDMVRIYRNLYIDEDHNLIEEGTRAVPVEAAGGAGGEDVVAAEPILATS